jgi:hypothetical protein
VKTIIFKKRKTPLTYVQLTNNQLTFSVIEVQISIPEHIWARSVDESHNWSNITYHLTSNLIKRVWRRYRLKKTLRAWLKTARVKEELIARAMHPSRYGQFEDLAPMKA